MIERCFDLIKLSTQRADEYYRAMTSWATSRRNHGSVQALIKLALNYKTALNRALQCLRGLKPSKAVENEIAKTNDYKSMIASDLELLNGLEDR